MIVSVRRALPIVVVVAVVVAVAFVVRGGGKVPTLGKESDGPRRGGVLKVGVVVPASLDPSRARTVDEQLVADQLFDGLTAYDANTLDPVPALAARWEATPDQAHWTFTLRPDAVFANGRPVTATDVKFSFERVAAKDAPSTVADLLEPVSGLRAYSQGKAPEVAGIVVAAPDTVRIDLDQPWADLPTALGNPALGIVPREAVEAEAPPFGEQPVGSGPFRLESRTESSITLAPSSGSRVLIERLELQLFNDVASSYRAFTEGQLDWSQVPAEQIDAAGKRYGDAAFRPYLAELFYAFNVRNPKLADVRFREAIVRAIDRRSVVAAVYGTTVRPTNGVVVAGVPAHQEDACGDRCRHDPDRARALVAEVFGDQPTPQIAIDHDDDKTQEAVAKAMQASLDAVGIAATLRPRPLREYQDFAVSGNQELFRLGWVAAYPSADAFLPPLFASGSVNNVSGLAVPAVDEALQSARAEADPARRRELYQAAERTILEHVPVVPLAQFEIHGVVASRVRGLVLTSMGTFDASAVWLASG